MGKSKRIARPAGSTNSPEISKPSLRVRIAQDLLDDLRQRSKDERKVHERVRSERVSPRNATFYRSFADRTSTAFMSSNQLRLWFSTFAYLLISRLRSVALSLPRRTHGFGR